MDIKWFDELIYQYRIKDVGMTREISQQELNDTLYSQLIQYLLWDAEHDLLPVFSCKLISSDANHIRASFN